MDHTHTQSLAERLADVIPPESPRGGRKKGARNRPKNLEDFIRQSLTKDPKPPKPPKRRPMHKNNVWAKMTPEERSAHAKALRSKVKDHSKFGRKPNTPDGWTAKAVDEARKAARRDARYAMDMLRDEGLVLPDETLAREALLEAFTILGMPVAKRHRLAAARLILKFTKPAPATKCETTIGTAEELLERLEQSTLQNDAQSAGPPMQ